MKSEKTRIVFIGRKNSGKSSLINAFFGRKIFDVSEIPGTTTGDASKAMELLPYGPVVLVDTAGIDDSDDIAGKQSGIIKSISSADFAVVLLDARECLTNGEVELFFYLDKISLPYIIAVNKIEFGVNPILLTELKNLKLVHFEISCKENVGLNELKKQVTRMLPKEPEPPLIKDLVPKGGIVIFVVSVDNQSSNRRLIISQIQTIREALDEGTVTMIIKEKELRFALSSLNLPPDLIVADSRIIMRIAADIPENIRLTTFAMLMSRYKGSLPMFVRGLKQIEGLNDGDKILIAEACSNHKGQDESTPAKIEGWLKLHTQKNIIFEHKRGGSLPEDLSGYKLIIHCSGCLLSRKMMRVRLNQVQLMDVPVINFGIMTSYMYGALPRIISPFSDAAGELK